MRRAVLSVCIMGLFAMLVCAGVARAEDKDPKEILDKMVKTTEAQENYKVIFEYKEPKEDKKADDEWRKCELWYGGDGYRRLAVLDGKDKGSKVSYNKDKSTEKVAAKIGMLPVVTVSVDDKRLSGFFESDWASDAKELAETTDGGEFSYLGEETVNEVKADKIQILPKKGDFDKMILWISQEDEVLIKYEYYKAGKLFAVKTWYDYKLDAGIPAKAFKP